MITYIVTSEDKRERAKKAKEDRFSFNLIYCLCICSKPVPLTRVCMVEFVHQETMTSHVNVPLDTLARNVR